MVPVCQVVQGETFLYYEVPDMNSGEWIPSNPKTHAATIEAKANVFGLSVVAPSLYRLPGSTLYIGTILVVFAVADIRIKLGVKHLFREIDQYQRLAAFARHTVLDHLILVGIVILEPNLRRLFSAAQGLLTAVEKIVGKAIVIKLVVEPPTLWDIRSSFMPSKALSGIGVASENGKNRTLSVH